MNPFRSLNQHQALSLLYYSWNQSLKKNLKLWLLLLSSFLSFSCIVEMKMKPQDEVKNESFFFRLERLTQLSE